MSQPSEEAQRLSRLDEAQRQALFMIASGIPLACCLGALTDVVGQLAPGTRACVLLANGDRTRMGDGYSSHSPPSFAAAIKGLPIGEALVGTCGAAIHQGRPVGCPDVEHSMARMRDEMDALNRLQALSAELVGPGQLEPLLQKILAAAADISGTDKGNIQIFDPAKGTLRIVVHQGLGHRLVEHFREDGWDASCGEAALQTQRLIVPDRAAAGLRRHRGAGDRA